jgi:hypothetical protein
MLGFNPLSDHAISDIALSLITGVISVTDSNDSATLTGKVAITGNINVTDGTDTCTIYAQELVSGYIYTTDGQDTATLTGAVAVSGTISATDGTDTATYTGQVLVGGSISATDGTDTATITALELVSGSISATDGTDTADFEGQTQESGSIYAIDGNDTCNIQAFVSGGMDMHDGFTKREIERAKALDRKRRAAEDKLIALRRADAENRKKTLRGIIDPVAKTQQKNKNKVQSKQEIRIDTPSVEISRLESVIANLDRQEKELNQAIAHRRLMAETMATIAILDAKFKAELDDEEALLMLL